MNFSLLLSQLSYAPGAPLNMITPHTGGKQTEVPVIRDSSFLFDSQPGKALILKDNVVWLMYIHR